MITYTKNNTHIENSYLIQDKKEIAKEVWWIREIRDGRRLPVTRSEKSYVREWIGHNKLYNLGLFKSHTKDVDLEEPSNIFKELIWLILGGF